ncbi:MAG: 2'-5' RNA ligase family protein, partial [Candidatus Aenigmatarchaeota archaeon]
MVRCFVGYILQKDEKNGILEVQKKMEKWPMKCKFVEEENLHLNFSFLGEIAEEKIKEVSKKIDLIGKNFEKFEVEVNGLIAIPNKNYIRVLALSVVY